MLWTLACSAADDFDAPDPDALALLVGGCCWPCRRRLRGGRAECGDVIDEDIIRTCGRRRAEGELVAALTELVNLRLLIGWMGQLDLNGDQVGSDWTWRASARSGRSGVTGAGNWRGWTYESLRDTSDSDITASEPAGSVL